MPKIKHICKECKKEFQGWACQNRKFCSNKCRLKVLLRENPEKRKTGKMFNCQFCKKEFYIAEWRTKANKGKYCSQECYWKDKSIKCTGKGNPQYIDGRVKKYTKAFYYSIKWRNLRKKVYERDNWICQICGEHGGELHAHHIIPLAECKNPFRKSNIITVCRKCHIQQHSLKK